MGAHFAWTVIVFFSCIALINTADLEEMLENVPDEDKLNFCKHHVRHGHELNNPQPNYQEGYSDDFSVEIYQYFLDNHLITDDELKEMIADTVCFPDGDCIDFDDPAVHPEMN